MADQFTQKLSEMLSCKEGPSPDILIDLAPFLPDSLLSRAIEIALAIPDLSRRVRTLLALAVRLPEENRGILIHSALAAALKIEDQETQLEVMRDLLLLIPESERWKLLREKTHKLDKESPAHILAVVKDPETVQALDDTLSSPTSSRGFDRPDKIYKESNELNEKTPSSHSRTEESIGERLARLPENERNLLVRETMLRLQTRVVSTGFAPENQADVPLDPINPLKVGQTYYFWMEVGQPVLHSIEISTESLPETLPTGTRLRVALFPFRDEIKIVLGSDVGELELKSDGAAVVILRPSQPSNIQSNSEILDQRLFFPVIAPKKEGNYRLRCNLYYEQILVQSRLIHAQVTHEPRPTECALSSKLDYSLSHTLWPKHLIKMAPHRLSMLLNNNDDGTHTLSLLGCKDEALFKNEAVISATELKNPIENARKALWKASWGDEKPLDLQEYRYKDQQCNLNRLEEDLISLARRGHILYNAIIDKLTGGRKESYKLAELMLKSGLVQIALRQSSTQVLPAALFYDYPLKTQTNHKLCEAFISALKDKVPLENTPCFNGACPSYGKLEYVCPSGFWGFRHGIGLPVSVKKGDAPPDIALDGPPKMLVGVATNLDQLSEHMQRLQEILPDLGWHYSENSDGILQQLKAGESHIVYFYCHGGLDDNTKIPYLQVGSGSDYIEGSILRDEFIYWDKPRPLIFLNGCRTTALDPEQAINLVQDFIGAGGAGVIGTEITIFEPLACEFAEECFRQFLVDNIPIGEAVRRARLKLLKTGNPLGLVYTPFVLPSLSLVKPHA
jgi:hypothetical protein